MPVTRSCPKCGEEVSAAAVEGLCPRCMGRMISGLEGNPACTAAMDSVAPDTKNRRFAGYQILEEVARGGMGVVFKARQVQLNRWVALKVILAGEFASSSDVQRFRAEAEAAADLQHPNIVAIHEIGEQDGFQFFTMDFVEGRNLAELVQDGPLTSERAAVYLKTIAQAIHYAHSRGIIHRDLKPSNILIDAADQPRVTDFGLAKRLTGPQPSNSDSRLSETNHQLTVTGQVLGTPAFIPPEQASGKHGVVGPHSDVYSLGAVLYFMLTAQPPFSGNSLEETLGQVLNSAPFSPAQLNPSVPRDLETICLKCLEKEPHRRYADAQELVDDLDRFLRGEPVLARPASRSEKFWRWCRRHPAVASLTLCLGITVAALLVMIANVAQNRRQPGFGFGAGHKPGASRVRGRIAPIPVRSGNGNSAVVDGKIYVTSPCDGHDSYANHFHGYDPVENEWFTLLATPTMHSHAAGGVIAGKFYVVGGTDARNAVNHRLDVYDPVLNTWSSAASLLTAPVSSAAVVRAGKLYVIGGTDGTNVLAMTQIYDPKKDRWATGSAMPTPRSGLGAAVINNIIYAAGGELSEGVELATLEALLPDGSWVSKARMPVAVSAVSVTAVNGIVYVAGGWTGPSEGETSVLQAYFPEEGHWKVLAPMPEGRYSGSGAQALNGQLYVFGGWTRIPGLPHDDVFVYDPRRNVWKR